MLAYRKSAYMVPNPNPIPNQARARTWSLLWPTTPQQCLPRRRRRASPSPRRYYTYFAVGVAILTAQWVWPYLLYSRCSHSYYTVGVAIVTLVPIAVHLPRRGITRPNPNPNPNQGYHAPVLAPEEKVAKL
eukprot:scaffold19330_cov45-Phaeocystis_antarctica.AAC.1